MSQVCSYLKKPERWPEERKAIREGRVLIVGVASGVPGIWTAVAAVDGLSQPIGRVDYGFFGFGTKRPTLNIVNSWVHQDLRRCGLRTLIHQRMLEWYPEVVLIRSDRGTADGAAWMKAVGYREAAGGWEFRPKRRK